MCGWRMGIESKRRISESRAIVIPSCVFDARYRRDYVWSLLLLTQGPDSNEAVSAAADALMVLFVGLGTAPIRLSCLISLKTPEYAHEDCTHPGCMIYQCR